VEIKQLVERVADIRNARPSASTRQRVAEAAQGLSLAGEAQIHVEMANEALAALTVLLYETDADGRPANIDRRTWRLLIPAPWGREGWRKWGLRSWEAQVLRQVLRVRNEHRTHVNLFDYDDQSRRWHLNRSDYPTLADALGYLKAHPVSLAEWRKHADILNAAQRDRMARLRMQRS